MLGGGREKKRAAGRDESTEECKKFGVDPKDNEELLEGSP